MRISKKDIPIKIETPAAVARQKTDFGDASGYGKIGGEYFTMTEGTDIAPLLEGLIGDACHSPHWGYLIKVRLTVTFQGGVQEEVEEEDLFYWPPGHTVRADKDSDFVLFSPQEEHSQVMDHINAKLGA